MVDWSILGPGQDFREIVRRDTCRNGHPMTPENTIWHGDQRRCRSCVASARARARAPIGRHHAFLGGYEEERPYCGRCHKAIHRNAKPSEIRRRGTWSHVR